MTIYETVLGVEQSVSGKRWVMRPCDERQALAISQKLDLPEIVGRILAARGVPPEEAADYLSPTLKQLLPDPSHLKDMDAAVARIAQAIMSDEKVAVFGDYDVDGATSSTLLVRYFSLLGRSLRVYIPDRMKEGYGPNEAAMLTLREEGVTLVITVDCGTVSFAPLAAAKAHGLDVVVIDHHAGEAQRPEVVALVNPNRLDESSPYRYLAAVGVTFLLLVALGRYLRNAGWFMNHREPELMPLLDVVALGTVCDVVPLVGLNRAFVTQGLKVMAHRANLGIRALFDLAGIEEKPTTYHAGFVLGPRINAGGRVGQSNLGVRLLTTEDPLEAHELALELERFNAERKAIEAQVQEEAQAMAEADAQEGVLVVAKQGWHPGVIGIVAGRLKERYDRPVAVIALEDGVGKASLRSVPGLDIGALVASAKEEGILLAGGGHAMAAGFSIAVEKLPQFREFCGRHLLAMSALSAPPVRVLKLDATVSIQGAGATLAQIIDNVGPFGASNPPVRLALAHVKIAFAKLVGENHVKVTLVEGGLGGASSTTRLSAMAFRAADTDMGQMLLNTKGRLFHMAGQLQLNVWQGRQEPQFIIEDIVLAH